MKQRHLITFGVSALVILLAAGWGHRVLEGRILAALQRVEHPTQPLSSLPIDIGRWRGKELPIDIPGLQVGNFDDEHVNRAYRSTDGQSALNVFIGYVGRPRTHIGHRPDVCYAAHGWVQKRAEPVVITAADGSRVPCMLYEFEAPKKLGPRKLVLATYLINGRYFHDADDLSKWRSRSPGLLGERPGYLTRVQISKVANSRRPDELDDLESFMALIAEPLWKLMPYREDDT